MAGTGSERLSAGFLTRVAEEYEALARESRRPGVALAEKYGVDPKQVATWVRQARRRGLSPPVTVSRDEARQVGSPWGFLGERVREDELRAALQPGVEAQRRAAREAAAKRALLALHPEGDGCGAPAGTACATLTAVLAVYVEHADFHPEWSRVRVD